MIPNLHLRADQKWVHPRVKRAVKISLNLSPEIRSRDLEQPLHGDLKFGRFRKSTTLNLEGLISQEIKGQDENEVLCSV